MRFSEAGPDVSSAAPRYGILPEIATHVVTGASRLRHLPIGIYPTGVPRGVPMIVHDPDHLMLRHVVVQTVGLTSNLRHFPTQS